MRIGNIAMLAAAFVCAAAAAFLSHAWLTSQTPSERVVAVQQAAPLPSRFIVVAARDLKSGDKLNAETLRLMPWASETLPKGTFASVDALLKGGQERMVSVAMLENEPVFDQKLAGSAQSLLAGRLTENMNAVTIRVNDVAGVAGFVQPEDRVDVFMTTGGGNNGESPSAPQGDRPSVAVLLQNVRVLAIDQASERKGQASPPKAVTLEVTTQDAQKLLLAGTIGQLSLALRRSNGVASGEPRPVAMDDLLARQPMGAAPAEKPGQVIGVTRAADRKEYMVQPESSKTRRSEAMR
jgi:pilus assembly protein CpaB